MNPKVNLACMISNFCIRVSGCIFKKLIDSEFEILTRDGQNGGVDGTDGFLHDVVNGSSIIIEKYTELLTVIDLSRSYFFVGYS